MKISFPLYGFILLFLCFAVSCNSGKSKDLTKAWKLNNLKYTQEIPQNMKPVVDNWVAQMRDSFTLIYNADGSYISRLGVKELKGRWELNYAASNISTTADDGSKKDFKIVELDDSKFSFEAVENGEKVIFEMVPAK